MALIINAQLFGQNLVMNPSFEKVHSLTKDEWNKGTGYFYADNWYQTTSCSFDILRSDKVCTDSLLKDFDPSMDFCVPTKSGDYCAGFYPVACTGYMEHLSGTLKASMKSGNRYKVSFWIQLYDDESEVPIVTNGIGIKFSKDTLSKEIPLNPLGEVACFYNEMFSHKPIFADVEILDCIIDKAWRKYEFIYVAKGGERFITIGKFASRKNKKWVKHFEKIKKKQSPKYLGKLFSRNKSLVCKNLLGKKNVDFEKLNFPCYYLLDDVSVELIDFP